MFTAFTHHASLLPNTMRPHLLLLTGLLMSAPALVSGCGPRLEASPGPTALEIRPQPAEPGKVTVLLTGEGAAHLRKAGAGSPDLLYLTVKGKADAAPVPILATRTDRAGECRLTPGVSLTRGLTYQAVFEGPKLSPSLPRLVREYEVPADTTPSDARVSAVFPANPEVPANLLKLYVHFSRPMGEGRVFEFARLLDADGKPIRQAFHEIELWSPDHRRLTLLINPGRTKRALGLSEWLGPVLEENRRYTLEIRSGLPDQQGRPLAEPLRHSFRTAGFDRTQPDLQSWRLSTPAPGSRAPLVIDFGEPLDRALAERTLEVSRAGSAVAGEIALDPETRRWSLTPTAPWQPGEYAIQADGDLEDLAGNSLLRPFETEAGNGPKPAVDGPEYRRTFEIR